MKFGMRTPSLKRSISARTTGQLKRSVKRAIIPGYGKKGWDGLKILKKPCITRYIIKRHLAFLICSNNYLKTEQERRHSFGIGTWGHQF